MKKKIISNTNILRVPLINFYLLISSLLYIINYSNLYSQIIPAISISPTNIGLCDGCTNLTANVQNPITSTNTYTVDDIPYTPNSYNTGNSVLVHIDDKWTSPITLPFCFQFYGNSYNQFIIGSNQIISFDLNQSIFCPFNLIGFNGLPNPSLPKNSIMAPYQDIDPTVSGSTYLLILGTAPYRKLVISFYNTPYFDCNDIISTSQIVLYETTNIIDVFIKEKPVCLNWNNGLAIEGIQNSFGTSAVVVPGRNNTVWNATDNAQRFTPTGSPQYTITWTDANNNVIGNSASVNVCPLTSTTYTATMINTSCNGTLNFTASTTVNIIGITAINLTSTATSCISNTGTASAIPVGGTAPYTYLWLPSGQTTQTATNLPFGNQIVAVTSAIGCIKTDTIFVEDLNTMVLNLSSTPINCFTSLGLATVSITGGAPIFQYLWSNGATTPTVNVSNSGIISLTVTDANGCSKSSSVNVLPPIYPIALISSNGPVCLGDILQLNSENGSSLGSVSTYIWSGPVSFSSIEQNTTISNVSFTNSGIYTVIVTQNGCSDTNQISVVIKPIPTIDFTSDVTSGCDPLKVNFINESTPINGLLLWGFGDGTTSTTNSHIYTSSGFYNVTLTSTSDGCSNTLTKNQYIHILESVKASFISNSNTTTNTTNSTIDNTDFTFINSSINGSVYNWTFGDGGTSNVTNPSHSFKLEEGVYEVTLYGNNSNNCPGSTSKIITITEPLIYFVPNSFTPDGDKFNEVFQPIFTMGYDPTDFNLSIFNRWGELIFNTKDSKDSWDGTYKGVIMPDGVYNWKIDYKLKSSAEKKSLTGNVNLLR